MFSFKSIVLIAVAFATGAECSAVAVAAPLVAPAHVGYAHTVPQNIPPYASQVSVVNRALVSPFAAPYVAAQYAPYAAYPGAPIGAPAAYAAPAYPAPGAYAPTAYAAPAPYAAAAYAAPFPYAPSAPIFRSPFGVAPAFVR